jgi:RHS repeat-associated protein
MFLHDKMKKLLLFGLCILFLLSFSSAYELEFYHSDHLGSPVVVTTESAEVVWSSDYDIFGEAVNEQGVGDLLYNQKEKDDTGLHYYGARYYNAELGRFITADTVDGEITDLQSLNRYIYVKNNPIKYIDPDGHKFRAKFGGRHYANFMNEGLGGIDAFSFNEETKFIELNDVDLSLESDSVKELFGVYKTAIESKKVVDLVIGHDGFFGKSKGVFGGLFGKLHISIPPRIDEAALGKEGSFIEFNPANVLAHETGHFVHYLDVGKKGLTEQVGVAVENLARMNMGSSERVFYSSSELVDVDGEGNLFSSFSLFTPEEFDEGVSTSSAALLVNIEGEYIFSAGIK